MEEGNVLTADRRVRIAALELANNPVNKESPDEVVARAQKYYDFLNQ